MYLHPSRCGVGMATAIRTTITMVITMMNMVAMAHPHQHSVHVGMPRSLTGADTGTVDASGVSRCAPPVGLLVQAPPAAMPV